MTVSNNDRIFQYFSFRWNHAALTQNYYHSYFKEVLIVQEYTSRVMEYINNVVSTKFGTLLLCITRDAQI